MADVAIDTRTTKPPAAVGAWGRLKADRNWLGAWFMLPAAAFLILFLAYPLGLGVWLSLTDARIGRSGVFIGFENYEWMIGSFPQWFGRLRKSFARQSPPMPRDSVFLLPVFNPLLYTGVAAVTKFANGL